MAQAALAKRTASRARARTPSVPKAAAAPKRVLCVLPRRFPAAALKKSLPGYELTGAASATATRRLSGTSACDLYLVYSPLGWGDAAVVCRDIRVYDAHTPIIVYALQGSDRDRREATAAGAQAYVKRSDDPHNLSGTVGQLIMLAELRSMDVMISGAQAMQERIARRLGKITRTANGGRAEPLAQAQPRLKLEARRMFASAGGTRANFERLWPALYESALKDVPKYLA